jgi:hypothetical protein
LLLDAASEHPKNLTSNQNARDGTRHEEVMRQTIFALVGAIALVGCGSTGNGGGEDQLAPAFPDGTGQAGHSELTYPGGPYGVGKGSIIANYKFVGYANAMKVSDALQPLQLAEFYNPTGAGVYEAGSVMEVGAAKPKALLIDVASVWCGPCNYEADQVLPGLHQKYKPQGGEFLLQLADGGTPGKAATPKNLFNWTQKYDVDYPATIDPTYKLSALFDQDAFPTNMIINTTTMEIVEVIAGAPEEGSSFWKIYEKVLAGTQ